MFNNGYNKLPLHPMPFQSFLYTLNQSINLFIYFPFLDRVQNNDLKTTVLRNKKSPRGLNKPVRVDESVYK